jgi:hypothetical protein
MILNRHRSHAVAAASWRSVRFCESHAEHRVDWGAKRGHPAWLFCQPIHCGKSPDRPLMRR